MTSTPRLTLLTTGVVLTSWLGLTATLRFPESLLDPPSYPQASVAGTGLVPALLSVLALIASGLLLGRLVQTSTHRVPGYVAAAGWTVAGLATLALVGSWRTGNDAPWLAWPAFVLVGVVAPAALAVWTLQRPRAGRFGVLQLLAAAGLIVTAARSTVWAVNTQLPPERGFYLTSAILTIAALIGLPLWLMYLVQTTWTGRGRRAGPALLAPVAALGFTAATIGTSASPDGTGATAVPSATGAAFYLVLESFPSLVPMPKDLAELRKDRARSHAEKPEVPSWATREEVNANGVDSEFICAREATKQHAILYLPGGGFTSIAGNGPRRFAAAISDRTKACVLLAHYRLAPEHPYPAGRDDGVKAYRWLLKQVGDAKKLAIMGDSAGGNLTVTTTLTLRRDGVPLPAAIAALSGVMDLGIDDPVVRRLADRDPLLTPPHRDMVQSSYLAKGTIDHRDPLLSPVYADPAGMPPTLLMVGTQEVLLGGNLKLAERFRAAKIPVELQTWPLMVHAWQLVLEEAPETKQANNQLARFFTKTWSSTDS